MAFPPIILYVDSRVCIVEYLYYWAPIIRFYIDICWSLRKFALLIIWWSLVLLDSTLNMCLYVQYDIILYMHLKLPCSFKMSRCSNTSDSNEWVLIRRLQSLKGRTPVCTFNGYLPSMSRTLSDPRTSFCKGQAICFIRLSVSAKCLDFLSRRAPLTTLDISLFLGFQTPTKAWGHQVKDFARALCFLTSCECRAPGKVLRHLRWADKVFPGSLWS